MDAKRQEAIIATARMVQALEDAERALDNALVQAGKVGFQGIIDDVVSMKKRIDAVRYSMFTAHLPPLEGTHAGFLFEEEQKTKLGGGEG